MKNDPLSTALKEIIETREMVESLIVSSETFDYIKAKAALRELSRKVRHLTRVRAELEALQRTREPNIYVVQFKATPLSEDPLPTNFNT